MEPRTRHELETRILAEVQTMLTEGDRFSLQRLSRTDFVDALANELRFLGLYAHDDTETPAVIQTLLQQHIDQWTAAIRNPYADTR